MLIFLLLAEHLLSKQGSEDKGRESHPALPTFGCCSFCAMKVMLQYYNQPFCVCRYEQEV